MNKMIAHLVTMKKSARLLRVLNTETKNDVLETLAKLLIQNQSAILAANQIDLDEYKKAVPFETAFYDRLKLSVERILYMKESLLAVVKQSDPVGLQIEEKELNNGLKLKKILAPLGLIFMIFESRPNVVTEAFSLAFKSGNAIILKGGKESDHTSAILFQLIETALQTHQLPSNLFWGLVASTRLETDFLMTQHRYIDVLIPRGGDALIEYVTQNSTIPLIKNDRGLCHVYIHADADQKMAIDIVDNAKTQRPGVCNSVETILVDEKIAVGFLPKIFSRLKQKNVQLFVCPKALASLPFSDLVLSAVDANYDREYLDLKLNVKVVEGFVQALEHIEDHGSHHSECIVTNNAELAHQFQNEVDAAVVYWNASTRFTDGFEFGLGAEIGISTQKLHIRGPVGLHALTSGRWIIEGNGQIRT
jgi:glutamate-5-semialdehyde dehydrogenase